MNKYFSSMIFKFIFSSIIEPAKNRLVGNKAQSQMSLIEKFFIFCKALEEGELRNHTIIHIKSSNF